MSGQCSSALPVGLQEMREHKKRVTDLDWSLSNDQLLTSSGAATPL